MNREKPTPAPYIPGAATALILCLFALQSCTPPKVGLGTSTGAIEPGDYEAVFKRWSRDVSVVPFRGMENVLTARVTYLSRELRQHLAHRRASDLDLSGDARLRFETEALEAVAAGHEFYVTAMSAVADCDDLTAEGPWTIRLMTDAGASVSPISVEEIDKPMPDDIHYFSFDPKLRKAYRLRFPLTDAHGAPLLGEGIRFFQLSFATAYGRDKVRWETTTH